MIEITRINLTGQQMPWWCDRITFGEVRLLRPGIRAHLEDRVIQETAKNIERYGRFMNELRHSTSLEF